MPRESGRFLPLEEDVAFVPVATPWIFGASRWVLIHAEGQVSHFGKATYLALREDWERQADNLDVGAEGGAALLRAIFW
jgi:hypothetical protein